MRSIVRFTLGITALAQVSLPGPTAAGQAASPKACALFDAAELKRLTGRKDVLGQGPQADETPAKGLSECEFLDLHFALTSNMTPEWFQRTRDGEVKTGMKVQPVSGVGDEAYYLWNPKPGSYRAVGIVYRSGSKQLAIGEMLPSDSIEVAKPRLLAIAKLTAPKVR